jgi:putative colanic acid biosysnthesis UDP-glucose lipid carrier transferase
MHFISDTDFLPINKFWRLIIVFIIPSTLGVILSYFLNWWGFEYGAFVINRWPGIVMAVISLLILKPDLAYFLRNNSYHLRLINYFFEKSFLLLLFGFAIFFLDQKEKIEWINLLYYVCLNFILMTALCCLTIEIAAHRSQKKRPARLAIVAVTESSLTFAKELLNQRFVNIDFLGFFEDRLTERLPNYAPFEILGRFDSVSQQVMNLKLEHVLVSLPTEASYRFSFVLEQLLDTTCSVHYLHDFLLFKPIRQAMTSVGNRSVFTVIDAPQSGIDQWLKRSFDIAFSLMALILLSPLFLAVALCIKIDSRGPVFFRQNRWGVSAESFAIYKFRSMTQETSEKSATGEEVVQTTVDDQRVTRVGAFIRRTSIDELPQLLNIFLGSMSFVGPRPHATSHNKEYRGLIRGYMLRHKVKPGLTGWAQIHGFRGETDTLDKMEKRVEYDLNYLRSWSLMMDIYIIFKTMHVVLIRKNAY